MIRNDFVSNSSSSSFIVASTDNKYDILLQDYDVLTLEEYIKHYIREDIWFYGYSDDKTIRKFLTDIKFNEAFSKGITNTFPISCKDDVDAYLELSKKRPNGNWDSDIVRKWSENLNSIFDNITKKILSCLELKWKDVKFHAAEVDDNWIYTKDGKEAEREDMCNTNEELVESRIDYMNSIKPLKFYRCFSHH